MSPKLFESCVTTGAGTMILCDVPSDRTRCRRFYAKLLWAVAIGYLVFGDVPQAHVIAGSVVIVASGLYTLYRERART